MRNLNIGLKNDTTPVYINPPYTLWNTTSENCENTELLSIV